MLSSHQRLALPRGDRHHGAGHRRKDLRVAQIGAIGDQQRALLTDLRLNRSNAGFGLLQGGFGGL